MPAYVTASYGLGLLGLPLAMFVPPPAAVVRRASAITLLLLTIGLVLMVAAVVVQALGYWYPGLAVGGGALATLFLVFWAANPGRRDTGDDDGDEGGGGGGAGPRAPKRDPGPSGGLAIDWEAFDRVRDQWAMEREVTTAA